MTRRFWVERGAGPAGVPDRDGRRHAAAGDAGSFVSTRRCSGSSSLLATPVVLWGGWPFFQRGWASLVNRSLNMFTLIALGVGVA